MLKEFSRKSNEKSAEKFEENERIAFAFLLKKFFNLLLLLLFAFAF